MSMNAAPSNLWEFIQPIQPGDRFALAVVLIVFGTIALVLIVGIIAATLRSVQKHRLDDALKRELVDRGMNATEIDQIVRVRSGARGKVPTTNHA